MCGIFLKIVNMSISAGWLVLAVVLLRLLLKKAPKWVCVLLWGIVAVRLICPFSIESVLSLIPSAETVSPEIMTDWTPEISTGISTLDTVVNPIITASFAPEPYASANPLQILIPIAAVVWVAGIAVMLLYTAVSYVLLRRKVGTAVRLRDNIYQSEYVDSPFVLGLRKPRIYLPFQMDGQNLAHVIAHEASHIRRKDHWWKPIGFLLLAIHWFNPLMWLGYILLCRDIELACDERVIKALDSEAKAAYTQALVTCSLNRRSIAACPLAFGEVGVKQRVKSVMNYRKPAFWIIVAAVVICIAVAVCFLTDPKEAPQPLPDIHSRVYVVSEVVYDSPGSSDTGEAAPRYAVTTDMQMLSHGEYGGEGQWIHLGELQQTELVGERFDSGFTADGWVGGIDAAGLRRNTEKAWTVSYYNRNAVYYILQQKSGALYLVSGDQAPAKDAPPGSFEERFYWVYRLAPDESGASGMLARSGDNAAPMIAVPEGATLTQYAHDVHWLTIDPGESLVPFTTWEGGEQVRGTYSAYDLLTGEALKFFLPSGLDPQTYLFQNADPTRAYVVVAFFYEGSTVRRYAFGARFKETRVDNFDSGPVETVYGNMKTYYGNTDGTWQVDGRLYRYRLVITGRMPNTPGDTTFVYLSNLEEISFERAWRAAGYSNSSTDYFLPEEAVLVELHAVEAGGVVGGTKKMTLADVLELSKLGMMLSWEDLKNYEGIEVGSGLYIVHFPIDPEFYLLVGCAGIHKTPIYAELNAVSSGMSCDIREQDVAGFISEQKAQALDYAIYKAIITNNADGTYPGFPEGYLPTESHRILATETASGTPLTDETGHMELVTVYLQYVYTRFYCSGGELEYHAETATAAAITFSVGQGGYTVKEYWEPTPGKRFVADVRSRFPQEAAAMLLDPQEDGWYTKALLDANYSKAVAHVAAMTGAASGTPVAWLHDPTDTAGPGFRFAFDIPYTKIVASCDYGRLIDAYSGTNITEQSSITVGAGDALYWTPALQDGQLHAHARISFTGYDGDTAVFSGAIDLTGRKYQSAVNAYIATLELDGFDLQRNGETVGAVVTAVPE